MATEKKEILVYAHWAGLEEPAQMGMLKVTPAKGKESFSFEYTESWLQSGFSQMIDPDLQLLSERRKNKLRSFFRFMS